MKAITVELDETTLIKLEAWGLSPAKIVADHIEWIQRAMDWEHERSLAIAAFVRKLQEKTCKEWLTLYDMRDGGPAIDLQIDDDRYYEELEDRDLHSAMELLLVERRGYGDSAFEYRATAGAGR